MENLNFKKQPKKLDGEQLEINFREESQISDNLLEEDFVQDILSPDDLLKLEIEDPIAYQGLLFAMEERRKKEEEEKKISLMEEEKKDKEIKLEKDKEKIDNYAKQVGFLKQEDIDKIIVGQDGIARYQNMTLEEFKDFDKERGWYR